MMRHSTVLVIITTTFLLTINHVDSCNEAVCGSIVSKCLLTQSCKCDLKNCTCCKECFSCLGDLYSECCSCVDMCPKPETGGTSLNKKSHVEEFSEKVAGLFQVLTEDQDPQDRWTSFTYSIDLDATIFAPKKEIKLHMQSVEQEVAPIKPNVTTLNCTVAFMSQCMSWPKCRSSCQSMGASSYRWFHDGCCECVGDTCINYGINESRCRKCSLKDEIAEDYAMSDDEIDYGEGMDFDDESI
ncbi:hypothetical protein ILUMI_04516 [Ignelater luminosus]|uniref:Protein twisted gastrulation n=1 Tax=Ignelater luminosus TaxID=2038154 RepID=A0A8K0D909_IGNLU|nr:hypothetical protein ILUMI_04516 [Ignelater luminosus]